MRSLQKGFTLIEMLVVIAIISILIGIGVNTFTIAQKKARDVRRKADLRSIQVALELYKSDTGKYPLAGGCTGYGQNCYSYSTEASWLAPLVPNYLPKVPKDPINNAAGPWNATTYSYAYGNIDFDGQHYDLVAQLENQGDPQRCELTLYPWYNKGPTGPTGAYYSSWCYTIGGNTATESNYSKYMYSAGNAVYP